MRIARRTSSAEQDLQDIAYQIAAVGCRPELAEKNHFAIDRELPQNCSVVTDIDTWRRLRRTWRGRSVV